MNGYLIIKSIHMLAVVAFLGNITTGLFWMRWARKSNDFNTILHTAKGVIASDRLFTIPAVIIITTAGIFTAIKGGYPLLRTGWIFWSLVLFTVSGILFSWKVAPLQVRMRNFLTNDKNQASWDSNGFDAVMKKWEFWGFWALITPVISFFMMIFKWPVKSLIN